MGNCEIKGKIMKNIIRLGILALTLIAVCTQCFAITEQEKNQKKKTPVVAVISDRAHRNGTTYLICGSAADIIATDIINALNQSRRIKAPLLGDTMAKITNNQLNIYKDTFFREYSSNYNIDFVKELLEDCEEKRVLTLIYKNPTAKEESQKDISAQKLVLQNDNIHLYGYDFDKKRSIVLNIKRIKSIITRYTGLGKIEAEIITVKFLLKNSGKEVLEENEQIIETTDDGIIVEGKYYNDFIAAQRILSFGANCIVYEPEDFKQDIIQKLKSMRRVYNG